MIHQTQIPAKHVHSVGRREHIRLNFAAWGTIACLMLASVVAAQDSSIQYVISPRVGESIDRLEREYFGLFPSSNDFLSATSIARPDGSIEFAINWLTNEGITTTSLVAETRNVEELRSLIDNFEAVLRREKHVRWDLFSGLAGRPVFEDVQSDGIRVITRLGETVSGSMLSATDTLLVLWQSSAPFDWRLAEDSVVALLPSEIEQITIVREGKFWSGAGYGALIGGGIGIVIGGSSKGGSFISSGAMAGILGLGFGLVGAVGGGVSGALDGIDNVFGVRGNVDTYRELVPVLQNEAMFRPFPPPEVQTIVKRRYANAPPPATDIVGRTNASKSEFGMGKFHISLAGGWMSTRTKGDMKKAFTSSGFGGTEAGFFGSIDYPLEAGSPFMWKVSAEYDVSDRLRLGLSWDRMPDQGTKGHDYEIENAKVSSIQMVAEYILIPADPQLLNRYEVAIGGGVSYNWLNVRGRVSSIFGSAFNEDPQLYELNKRGVGFVLRGSVDHYFSRYISFLGSIELRTIPSIDVPSVTHVSQNNNETKTLIRHSVGFSGVTVTFGPRFHF